MTTKRSLTGSILIVAILGAAAMAPPSAVAAPGTNASSSPAQRADTTTSSAAEQVAGTHSGSSMQPAGTSSSSPAHHSAVSAPVIVLDPGHSGKDIHSTDSQTGLVDHDYPNHPEMEECFRIAKVVQSALEKQGYRVVCTKNTVSDSVSLKRRAAIAQEAKATLGVSIHDDHGKKFSSFAQVYAQGVGLWRGNTAQHPKASFTSSATAATSRRWAAIMAEQRSLAEGHKVEETGISFNGRPGIEPGNIPQVELFAGAGDHPVPWIYNEVGGIGLGPKQEAQYALGLIRGIEKCVPLDCKAVNSD